LEPDGEEPLTSPASDQRPEIVRRHPARRIGCVHEPAYRGDQLTVHYEVAGDGPAVVLVHAGICDSRMWDPQWTTFARDHRTIRHDLRGFGRSALTPGSFSHAGDLATLLETLGVDRTVLVAASYGAQVALELTVARPDLVEAVVLVDASLPGHDWSEPVRAVFAEEEAAMERGDLDAAVEAILRTWVDGHGRPPEVVDPAVRERVRVMQRRALELQLPVWQDPEKDEEQEMEPGWVDRLGTIQAPALVLVGEHDVADIHVLAERLARELPQATAGTIVGAAHLPSMERPADFDERVLAFLAEHRGR
jgi:3-oxoadipate enol-lactonase